MKLSFCILVTILLVTGCLLQVDAFIRQRGRSCYDCWGRKVRPDESYFDGCNNCICSSWYPLRAVCTLRYCRYNMCYKPFGNLQS